MREVRIALDAGGRGGYAADATRAGSPLVPLRSSERMRIEPFGRMLVPTGARVALPSGCGGFVVTEAAMARRGLMFANAPGLIDEGYRGEVGLAAVNFDASDPIDIERGDLLAYMLVLETARCRVATIGESDEQRQAERGDEMAVEPIVSVAIHDEAAGAPAYAHETDNGMDLRCAEAFHLEPFERREVRLGIGIGLSDGLIAQIQPRSGLALKQGLSVAGSPHILESPRVEDELVVPFVNLDPSEPIDIEAGTRVAQLVIFHADPVDIRVVDSLEDTDRGSGGFGSTGV